MVTIRNPQHITPVRLKAAFLLRVPGLRRYPAGAFGGEAEFRPGPRLAAEDAVTGAEDGIDGAIRNFLCGFFQQIGALDRVDAEVAQLAPLVAPGIEIPVLTVVDDALGRDFAFAELSLLRA